MIGETVVLSTPAYAWGLVSISFGLLFVGFMVSLGCDKIAKAIRGPEPEAPEVADEFYRVTVTNYGGRKILAIKHIRAVTGFGLKEAKEAAEGQPFEVSGEEAAELTRLFAEDGIAATVRDTS